MLTNYFIVNFTGSELLTLSLAKFLNKLGNRVTVATFQFDNPLMQTAIKEQINVIKEIDSIKGEKYDLIWSHHAPVLCACLKRNIRAQKVIFSSLSPFEPLQFKGS